MTEASKMKRQLYLFQATKFSLLPNQYVLAFSKRYIPL